MHPHHLVSIAAALALSCTSGSSEPAARFEDCTTADCRAEWAAERWMEDRAAVEAAMASLEEPIARLALIMALTEEFPGTTGPLCTQIPDRVGREHCESINARPHLRADAPAARVPSPDAAQEEALYPRLQLAPLEGPWVIDELTPPSVDCPTDFRARTCWTYTASQEALTGATDRAAAACAGIEAGKWRDECLFQAAEVLPLRGEDGALSTQAAQGAMGLCLSAGRFRASCISHLLHDAAQAAPAADMAAATAWTAHAAAIEGMAAEITRQDGALGADLIGQARARSMQAAVAQAEVLAGNPADHLDPSWLPHLRAALAVSLLSSTPPPADLSQAQTALQEAMAHRAARPLALLPPAQPADTPVWSIAPEGMEAHTRTWYLGEMRRFTSADEELDGLLVIIEAAARTDPVRLDLLQEASRHEDALVSGTAARHLERASP